MHRFVFSIMVLGLCVVFFAADRSLANPVDMTVPTDSRPTLTTGRVSFNNAHAFRQYTLLLGRALRLHPGEYYQNEKVTLCAVPSALLDSIRHEESTDSIPPPGTVPTYERLADFLRSDSRILTAGWTPPPIPRMSYTLPHGGCKIIEDECHIVRLDSAGFEVQPVRAVYRFINTDYRLMTTVRLPYRNPAVRPEPNMFLLRLRYSVLYGGLSAGCLLAFVITIIAAKRRRKA